MALPHGGDWDNTFTLKTLIPALGTTLTNLQKEVADAKRLEQAAQNKLVSQVQAKLSQLTTAINAAQKLYNDLSNNLDTTGVHRMMINPNSGGYNGLITDLSVATNKPFPATAGFYAGYVVLVTAPDITQCSSFYSKLQKLFTLQ